MPASNSALRSTISDIEQNITFLEQNITFLEQNITFFEQDITFLEAELDALRAEKEEHEEELRARVSLIPYSEHPLPPNILSKVLVFEANSDGNLFLGKGKLRILALASVCRQWRDAAFTTGELWKSITALGMLSTWLPRSGTLPININLHGILPTSVALWDVLVPHSARWRSLELEAPEPVVLSLTNAASDLPFFESLSIRGDVALEDGEHISAPNLRSLKLTTPFVVYQLALPLKQITSLDLTGESGAGILDMLALMPDLTSLVLSIQDTEPDASESEASEAEATTTTTTTATTTAPSSPCVLTQLASLQYNHDLPPYILAGLYTPLLAHLTFSSLPPFYSMQSLITRSNSSIRSLKLKLQSHRSLKDERSAFFARTNDYIRPGPRRAQKQRSLSKEVAMCFVWFKGLPDLEVLDVRVDKWTKNDFAQFHDLVTGRRRRDGTLSELERITLRGCPRDLDAALFGGLVAKRWHWVQGLTRVHTLRLSFQPPPRNAKKGVSEQLQGNASEYVGLNFRVWEENSDSEDEE
ncbi:hypothetical protein C8F01DRAFT_1236263 [Mycena amicta]|nr:hypothetical protein C8F01DRAFT_1236263 [Mycena amicta]